jgi:uncharacterized protein (TIGR03067 family)
MHSTILFAAIAVAAPGAKAPIDKGPNIIGTWEIESLTRSGKEDETVRKRFRYTFNRDGTWVVSEGDKVTSGPRGCRIDAKANPPAIDLNTPPSPSDSPTVFGIFKIEGDRLKMCIAPPRAARPTDFESPAGSGVTLIILLRVKAKD